MLNRWIEPELLDAVGELGVGCIVFSPLAQGMLTDKYLDGIPEGSRASWPSSLSPDLLTEEALEKIRALNEIAAARGQTLAQMALAWVLRDPRVTSALIGASSVQQLEDNVGALANLDFTDEELAEIDRYATDSGINIWADRATARRVWRNGARRRGALEVVMQGRGARDCQYVGDEDAAARPPRDWRHSHCFARP